MGKVKFQVDGLDSNTTSEFNQDVTFDGNIDANSISISGPASITQSGNHASYPITISSSNEQAGGTGYSDIIKIINSKSGASNINKHIRLSSIGEIQIVNSAYNATIFSLSDNGNLVGINNLSVNGTINGATINNDAWTSFTPALSTELGSWTIGNGSIEASYKLIGKTCNFKAKIVWGSTTSTGSGALQIGLPVTAKDANYQFTASLLDNGNAWYQATGNGMYNNDTSKFAMIFKSGGTGSSSEGVSATAPFTFASGDYISINGTYEVA